MKNIISKSTLIILLTVLVFQNVSAEDKNRTLTVSSAVPFLLISPDARASGYGDIGAATSTDANSQHWNPAKYPYSDDRFGLAITYSPWLSGIVDDIGLAYLAGYYKIGEKQAVSMGLKFFSLGEITFTDQDGNTLNKVSPTEFQISAAYSRKFSELFSASLTGSYIYSNLQLQNAGGTSGETGQVAQSGAVDIGLLYRQSWDMRGDKKHTVGVGLHWANIGAKMSYSGGTTEAEKDFLPTQIRLGIDYKYDFDKYNSIEFMSDFTKLLVPAVADTVKSPSAIAGMFLAFADKPFMTGSSISIGTEYSYRKLFSLRAGYYFENEASGGRNYVTLGVGLRYSMVAFDFSYLISIASRSPLDNTLRFTLSLNFPDRLLQKRNR